MTGSRPARPAGATTGETRAWGWVDHLRSGGTTPWRAWSGDGDAPGRSRGRYLPGAQQLELLRLLNATGSPGPALAESVVTASAAGRGRPDLELVGVGAGSQFGPAPVDPGDLSPGELMRVAASVLADQLVAAGVPTPEPMASPRLWRRGYRLVGDPELADPLRIQLTAHGRPPGGRSPRILVLGTDLATMAGHAWTHRAFTEGAPGWREWLALLRDRHEVPGRVDLLAMARTWERRSGRDLVHVVLDPGAVPTLVRDRHLVPPVPLPAEAGELARRVGWVLGLLVTPEARADLLTTRLRPRAAAAAMRTSGVQPLVVPPEHYDWLSRAAERMRTGLHRAGYPVLGDLDDLVPRWPGGADDAGAEGRADAPAPGATLDLAVRVLLDQAEPEMVPDKWEA